MADYHNPSSRVGGQIVGRAPSGNRVQKNRYLTPEQKEQADSDTQRAYQAWKAEREARLNRMTRIRIPEASELRHKDIIM